MAENNQTPKITTSLVKSVKFVDMNGDGLIIKLEGYPIHFIRIIMNRERQHYSILFRDRDGWTYRVKKVTELGDSDLFKNHTRMILEEVCT